jgi:hypothetical protein
MAAKGQRIADIADRLEAAAGARLARMHVDAIGAAVDLRGARLDQVDQRMVEPALLRIILERYQGLHCLGRGLVRGLVLGSSVRVFRSFKSLRGHRPDLCSSPD